MGCCLCIEQANVGIKERYGQFEELVQPGCTCFPCGIVRIRGPVCLRVSQQAVKVDSFTKDNVSVTLDIQIQYKVNPNKVYEAYYSLDNVSSQIHSYVLDAVRDKVPQRELDHVLRNKQEVAKEIRDELTGHMDEFGYEIVQILITEVEIDHRVKAAMNDIVTSERQRAATLSKAEANKIVRIKEAEAEAEARELSGKGLAAARAAIVKGLQKTVESFTENVEGVNPSEVMNLVLTTQYYDTLKEIGAHSGSNVIFLPPKDSENSTRESLFASSLFRTKKGDNNNHHHHPEKELLISRPGIGNNNNNNNNIINPNNNQIMLSTNNNNNLNFLQ